MSGKSGEDASEAFAEDGRKKKDPKSAKDRTKDYESSRKGKGYRRAVYWIPTDENHPTAAERMKELAADLSKEYENSKSKHKVAELERKIV